MTNEDLRKYVMKILDYLRSDFNTYENARDNGTKIGAGPYLLTASSGIDFLGSLAVPEEELKEIEKKGKGLGKKSTAGSKWYIKNYLGKVNTPYSGTNVDDLFYRTLRCGQVHEGIIKAGVLIGTEISEPYHLKKLKLKESDVDNDAQSVVYVNTRILASDFIKSINFFIDDMNSDEPFTEKMATRLETHLNTIRDIYQSLDLPELEIDPDIFQEIYERSSSSPQYPEGSYRLRPSFWEKA